MADITHIFGGSFDGNVAVALEQSCGMVEYALRYAALGWHVFPLIAGTKDPATAHGFKDATDDPDIIRKWWSKWPDANIGFVPASAGLAALDVDTKDGGDGFGQLQMLQDLYGDLPDSLNARTPSGAQHRLFTCTESLTNAKIADDIDVRSGNGYIAVEPSVLADGTKYEWDDWDVLNEPLPAPEQLPGWCVKLSQDAAQRAAQDNSGDAPDYAQPTDTNALHRRFSDALRSSRKMNARYHGDPGGLRDTSGSAMDMSMVAMMKLKGFTFSETVYLLSDWEHGSSNKQRNGNRYWSRCWMRTSDSAGSGGEAETVFADAAPFNLFDDMPMPAVADGILPDAIWSYSKDQAELIGSDPLAMSLFCMAVAGSCIDDRIEIQPKRHDPSWRESARLWAGVIADPSAKKSPMLKKALSPVFAIDKEWRNESNKAIKKWEQAYKKAEKSGDELPEKPLKNRMLINDATVEKIGAILSESQPRGILSYQDELSGWLGAMDAYKNGAGGKDKGSWLEAYNGGPKFFDRIARGELYVDNWSVSVVGGIQPDVIQKYASSADHDGMLQRFILVYATPNKNRGQDRPPNVFASTGYRELIQHLASLKASDDDTVELSEDAHRHREWLAEKVHNLLLNHSNKSLVAALGKWEGLFARLLLIWHCADCADAGVYPVNKAVTGDSARRVAHFMWQVLLPHAVKFYSALDPHEDGAKDLARLILAKGWDRFTVKRDFNQQWKASRRMDRWEIRAILDRLDGFNWIAPDPSKAVGNDGQPAAYIVNPAVHELHENAAQVERQRRAQVTEAMAEIAGGNG